MIESLKAHQPVYVYGSTGEFNENEDNNPRTDFSSNVNSNEHLWFGK